MAVGILRLDLVSHFVSGGRAGLGLAKLKVYDRALASTAGLVPWIHSSELTPARCWIELVCWCVACASGSTESTKCKTRCGTKCWPEGEKGMEISKLRTQAEACGYKPRKGRTNVYHVRFRHTTCALSLDSLRMLTEAGLISIRW